MPDQGVTYAAFIESQLSAEYERTEALGARATAITTSSSAFLALVLALTVLVTGKDYVYSGSGARWVIAALVLFLVAGVLGFTANIARRYDVPTYTTLRAMVDERWKDDEVDARNVVAFSNVVTIETLRAGNNARATLIMCGACVQLAAVMAIIISLCLELWPLIRP